jgi:hypothetical protein
MSYELSDQQKKQIRLDIEGEWADSFIEANTTVPPTDDAYDSPVMYFDSIIENIYDEPVDYFETSHPDRFNSNDENYNDMCEAINDYINQLEPQINAYKHIHDLENDAYINLNEAKTITLS